MMDPKRTMAEIVEDTPSDVNVVPASLAGDLVVLGSPVSNLISQLIFDYEGTDPAHLRRAKGTGFDLRWTFVIDQVSAILEGYQGVPPRYPVGNWRVMDHSVGDSGASKGSVVRDGGGENDYLLITRLRNFLDQESLGSGHMMTIIGGAHGLGTVGIATALRTKAIMETLSGLGSQEFQAVIEVSKPQLTGLSLDTHGLYDVWPARAALLAGSVEILRIPDVTYEEQAVRVRTDLTSRYKSMWNAER